MKTTGKSNATLTIKNSNKQQLRLLIAKQSAKVELLSCKAAEIKLGSIFLPSSSFVLFLFCSSFYAKLLLFFLFFLITVTVTVNTHLSVKLDLVFELLTYA